MFNQNISVVIPFYNARDYIAQAVESALEQSETGEVIIVEDGSPDNGLHVCVQLASTHEKVRLLRHPGGENRGAAASRNLGITHAVYPYIAFLDADDFYLPNRFFRTVRVFQEHPDADGVYEATGTFFEDLGAKEDYQKSGLPLLTSIKKKDIPPDELFVELMRGGIGHFSFDAFTAKTSFIRSLGCFDEKLKIFEDTDLIFKLSAIGKLYPGNISEPVAIRRVHKNNRVTQYLIDKRKTYFHLDRVWQSFLEWGLKELPGDKRKWLIRRRFSQLRQIDYADHCNLDEFVTARSKMVSLVPKNPWTLVDAYCWRRFIPARPLVKTWINLPNRQL